MTDSLARPQEFVSKRTVKLAMRWTGENPGEMWEFCEALKFEVIPEQGERKYQHNFIVPTLEGEMRGSLGDWLVRGISGEFYPCKPDIFAQSYELAGAASISSPAPLTWEQWRREFPCSVIHQSYPDGATCLDCREFAVRNESPHTFTPEFRQRYIEYDRTLFCDNCWSCIRSGARLAGEGKGSSDEIQTEK